MRPPLRILILTPTALPEITGNAMTAERWRRGLSREGCPVEVVTTRSGNLRDIGRAIIRFRPDVLHIHHIFQSGSFLIEPSFAGLRQDLPVVATPAGTDLNQDLQSGGRRDLLTAICDRIAVIVVQNRCFARLMGDFYPPGASRIRYVPKSFLWLGDDPFPLREHAQSGRRDFLFFLPAGIRPVKGNLEGLLALEQVHQQRPRIRAVFTGPVLDREYGDYFRREIGRLHSFACWLPAVSPSAMRAAYGESDVVLNTSISEGLSNVLIEAIVSRKPILAADIEGNRWPIRGEAGAGPCGLLYEPGNREDFVAKAVRLVDDDVLRADLVRFCRERASGWPSPETEIAGLIAAYRQAVETP